MKGFLLYGWIQSPSWLGCQHIPIQSGLPAILPIKKSIFLQHYTIRITTLLLRENNILRNSTFPHARFLTFFTLLCNNL